MNQTVETEQTAVRADTTPLMRQYNEIKARNPDTVLLYRMGDFYEMFNEDARIASKVLGITLTSRNHGGAESVPLAGFPYHALERYANRLVKAGHKIAICEQTEDPKQAKGIVKRDIVEVITAGTATEDSFIEERTNNFIISFYPQGSTIGLAVCDLSTGFFQVEEIDEGEIENEIVRIDPSEILISDTESHPLLTVLSGNFKKILFSKFDAWKFSFENAADSIKKHFRVRFC